MQIVFSDEPGRLTPEMQRLMEQAGFRDFALRRDGPQHEQGRLFITAVRGE